MTERIAITVDGRRYEHIALDPELAGLTRAREAAMADLRPGEGQTMDTPAAMRPGYVVEDAVFLEASVAEWAARTGADAAAVQACMERCLRSWGRLYA